MKLKKMKLKVLSIIKWLYIDIFKNGPFTFKNINNNIFKGKSKMTLLKEILQINESITFELDVAEDLDTAMETAASLGATNIQPYDTNDKALGFSLTVTDQMMGNVIIDAIYGTDDGSRDSNEFYMGLED